MLNFFELKEKNIVIVGVSGAIGSAICLSAHKFGARILGFDLIEPEKIVPIDFFYAGDATAENDVIKFTKQVIDLHGKIDVVILCNGTTGEITDVEKLDIDNFKICLNSSIVGATLFIKHFSPLFKKSKEGNFILFSSIAGSRGASLMPAYTSAKHAINGLMKSFARELGPWGIRLNAISPGLIKSKMAKSIQYSLKVRSEPSLQLVDDILNWEESANSIPLRRVGTPDDVAKLALFLMSPASSYIHGAVINIDGGLSVKY